jgi:hypothetical protein
MTQLTTLDWDAWRTAYPHLTYTQHQDFYSLVYAQHPEQRHYSTEHVEQAIEQINPRTVVELGGWDGELAHTMLEQYPDIRLWRNVEICREAAAAGEDRHPRYDAVLTNDWYWNKTWTCDLFVASHVIEHLSRQHLDAMVGATNAKALYMDAPLTDQPYQWQGFTGTHILNYGWAGITRTCKTHGYTLAWDRTHRTDETSGGYARACLYLKA